MRESETLTALASSRAVQQHDQSHHRHRHHPVGEGCRPVDGGHGHPDHGNGSEKEIAADLHYPDPCHAPQPCDWVGTRTETGRMMTGTGPDAAARGTPIDPSGWRRRGGGEG